MRKSLIQEKNRNEDSVGKEIFKKQVLMYFLLACGLLLLGKLIHQHREHYVKNTNMETNVGDTELNNFNEVEALAKVFAYEFDEHLENIDTTHPNPEVLGRVAITRLRATEEVLANEGLSLYYDDMYEMLQKYFSYNFPICVEIVDLPFDINDKTLDLEKWKRFDAIFVWGMWPRNPLEKYVDELNIIVTSDNKLNYQIDDKFKVDKYIQQLNHIVPTPLTLMVDEDTNQSEFSAFIENIKMNYDDISTIRCKPGRTTGGRFQIIKPIEEIKLKDVPKEYLCQPSLDPHDIFFAHVLVGQDGEILDFIIYKFFNVYRDGDKYYHEGVVVKIVAHMAAIDKEEELNTKEGELIKKMIKYIHEVPKVIPLRGFINLDFLLHHDDLYFLEINPRTGGASYKLDKNMHSYEFDQTMGLYFRQFEKFKNIKLRDRSEYNFWNDIYDEGNYVRSKPIPEDRVMYNKLFPFPEKCKK